MNKQTNTKPLLGFLVFTLIVCLISYSRLKLEETIGKQTIEAAENVGKIRMSLVKARIDSKRIDEVISSGTNVFIIENEKHDPKKLFMMIRNISKPEDKTNLRYGTFGMDFTATNVVVESSHEPI